MASTDINALKAIAGQSSSYQDFLNRAAASGGINGQEAGALSKAGFGGGTGTITNGIANVLVNGVGDLTGNYGLAGILGYNDKGHIVSGGQGYGPEGLSTLNGIYSQAYSAGRPANDINSGGTQSAWTSADQANYDAAKGQVNYNLGRLPNQLRIAQGNITDAYGNAIRAQDTVLGNANNQFNQGTTQNQQSYRTSQNEINSQAASDRHSLLRYLASIGAGGGSEAEYMVPNAVGKMASQGLSGAANNFAQNNRALTTNIENFRDEDKQKRIDLANEKANQLNQVKASNDSARASLLQQLQALDGQRAASLGSNVSAALDPYVSQINKLNTSIDNLGRLKASYSGPTAAYVAPELAAFAPTQSGLNQQQIVAQANGASTPYLELLLNADKRKDPSVFLPFDARRDQLTI